MFGLPKRAAHHKGRIGLVFASDHIALAIVTRDRSQICLTRCEILPVDAVAGPAAFAAALRAAELPRVPVSTVLDAADYKLALVEAPDVPPAELRAAMRWRLKDAIDYKVEDAVIDVFDVPPPSATSRLVPTRFTVITRQYGLDRSLRM